MFLRFAALTVLFSFFIYWFHIRMQPEDPARYQKLVDESVQLRTRRALEEEPAFQERLNVQKDIWTQNETHHFRIQSEGSHLKISQKRDKIEATEVLKKIHCAIPNGFRLLADTGIYTYPSHQFIAEENCRLLQNKNQIDGTRIHLDLIEETVLYENPRGKIALGLFDFTAQTLFWEKNGELLYLIDDVCIKQTEDMTFLAKKGTVYLEEFEPKLVVLEGNVRLISSRIQGKESYAMADRLTYDPSEKTLLFSADKRVLFWQDGLTMSATEVLVRENQTIEGYGNVHFTLDLEEQNCIDEFFKQYL